MILSFFSSPLLTIFLATITPTCAFTALNLMHFTNKQAINAIAIITFFSIIFCFATNIFLQAIPFPKFFEIFHLQNFVISLFAGLIFILLSERFITETILKKVKKITIFVILLLISFASGFFTLITLNIILFSHFIFSIFDMNKTRKTQKLNTFSIFIEKHTLNKESKTTTKNKIIFTKKPNIYLLLLESFVTADAYEYIFKTKEEGIEPILKKFGFEFYRDIYSNAGGTFLTVASLMGGDINNAYSYSFSKNNYTFTPNILRDNGYSFEIFDTSGYITNRFFYNLLNERDFTSFSMKQSVLFLYSLAGPIFAQSSYLRKIVGGVDPFRTSMPFPALFESFKTRVLLRLEPRFFFMRFGATHIDRLAPWSRTPSPGYAEKYTKLYQRTKNDLSSVLELITETDPDAIIIVTGDHGTRQHASIHRQKDFEGMPIKNILEKLNISTKDYAMCTFRVPLGIFLPSSYKKDMEIISHVNLFKYIFDLLGAKRMLDNLSPDISICHDHVFVQNGKILDSPVHVKQFIESIEKNTP